MRSTPPTVACPQEEIGLKTLSPPQSRPLPFPLSPLEPRRRTAPGRKATTIVISLRNSRQGDKTPPGPALQASRPAERGSRTPAPPGRGGDSAASTMAGMVFSQVFVMAPIRSQDAELVFDVTQARHSGSSSMSRGGGDATGGGSSSAGAPKRAGTCRVSLRELADQREHDLPLTVLKKASRVVSSACWRRGCGQRALGLWCMPGDFPRR